MLIQILGILVAASYTQDVRGDQVINKLTNELIAVKLEILIKNLLK